MTALAVQKQLGIVTESARMKKNTKLYKLLHIHAALTYNACILDGTHDIDMNDSYMKLEFNGLSV